MSVLNGNNGYIIVSTSYKAATSEQAKDENPKYIKSLHLQIKLHFTVIQELSIITLLISVIT